MKKIVKYPIVLLLLSSSIFLVGCASTNSNKDPYESMNRAVFSFNEKLDENVVEPVARGYKRFVPDPIERIVSNVFSNANDVVVLGNSILQLNFKSAAATATRLVINSTFGLFGAIDIASDISVASDINISKRNEDFGQTLGYYGIGSGPYLVLPFMGPSSARDSFGLGVDALVMHPVTNVVYLRNIDKVDKMSIRIPVATGMTLDARAQLLGVDKSLEEAALDKYEFVRDAYLQRRESLVNNQDVELTN